MVAKLVHISVSCSMILKRSVYFLMGSQPMALYSFVWKRYGSSSVCVAPKTKIKRPRMSILFRMMYFKLLIIIIFYFLNGNI